MLTILYTFSFSYNGNCHECAVVQYKVNSLHVLLQWKLSRMRCSTIESEQPARSLTLDTDVLVYSISITNILVQIMSVDGRLEGKPSIIYSRTYIYTNFSNRKLLLSNNIPWHAETTYVILRFLLTRWHRNEITKADTHPCGIKGGPYRNDSPGVTKYSVYCLQGNVWLQRFENTECIMKSLPFSEHFRAIK